MLRTNHISIVKQSLKGKIHHPVGGSSFKVEYDGRSRILPSTGGITYNVHVGDNVFRFAGDHIEPSVSIRNENNDENASLMSLACLGNEARIVSGDAKGAIGYVLGGHGGINHTILEFNESDMEKMTIGDSVQVKGYGQGLELLDFPDIKIMNIDPSLLSKIEIIEENDHVVFPVAAIIPGKLMGSGIGAQHSYAGDCDIMTKNKLYLNQYNLHNLQFGDFILIRNWDSDFGRSYSDERVTIGVVIHGDSIKNGHGPGIMSIMTGHESQVRGVISSRSNVNEYMMNKV